MQAAAAADKELGHMATPVMVELKCADGSLKYEVVDGPRCDHTCAKCQEDMAELRAEFGKGAIGAFSDSSGGEMERLRAELRNLATVLTKTLAPISERLDKLEAASVAEQKTLVEKT